MRALMTILAVAVSALFIADAANTQQKQTSDSEYITQALSAAPEAVAKGAAVVRVEKDGSLRNLRAGNNGFTCMSAVLPIAYGSVLLAPSSPASM